MTSLHEASWEAEGAVAIVLHSPWGGGLTDVVREWRRSLLGERVTLLEGVCQPGGGTYRPLREIVTQYVRTLEDLGLLDDALARAVDEVAPSLGMPTVEGLPASALAEVSAEDQLRFYERLGRVLVQFGARLPVTLLIHDLHLADSATRAALDYVLGHVVTDPVQRFAPSGGRTSAFRGTVVVTASERGGRFASLRALLAGRDNAHWISLRDVEEEAVRRFLQSDAVIERLMAISGGVPDNLTDVIASLPSKVEDLYLRRLERLGPSERRVLEALAVIGRPVTPDFALRVTDDQDGPPSLAALAEQRLIVRQAVRGDLVVGLPNEDNAQALYEQIAVDRRARLHGRIATMLEQRLQLGQNADLERIAHHALHADDVARALKYALEAAERLHISYAYDRARDVLEAVLPRLSTDRDRAAVLERLVELCAALNAYDDALEFSHQLADAAPLAKQASIVRRQAEILLKTGAYETALQRVDSASKLAREHLDEDEVRIELLRLAALHAEARYGKGEYERALAVATSALEGIAADDAATRRGAIQLTNTQGKVHLFLGRYDDAKRCFEANEAAARALGSTDEEVRALFNLGTIALQRREYADAERTMEACRSFTGPMSNPVTRSFVELNLAVVFHKTGRFGAAIDAYLKSLATFQQTGNELQFAVAAMNLGSLYETLGEVERARELLARSVEVTSRREIRYFHGRALYVLGHLELSVERWEEAEEVLAEAAELLQQTGSHTFGERILLARARAAAGVGDVEQRERWMSAIDVEGEGAESAEVRAEVELYRGRFLLEDDDAAAAVPVLARAVEQFESLALRERLWLGHSYHGVALACVGRFPEAVRALTQAVDGIDAIAQSLAGSLRDRYLADRVRRRVRDALESARAGHAPSIGGDDGRRGGGELRDPGYSRWRGRYEAIVGDDARIVQIFRMIDRISDSDSTVLIQGESGTGKELIAEAIHRESKRSTGAFVKVNCAAFVETLLLSELFGHEKGAFTGAMARKAGRFELADGGTLFLDEIGDISPNTQVALLRVLQDQQFERVGGSETVRTDVRMICATNRNLEAMVKAGTFRLDLYYRLKGVVLEMPPLRDRRSDIPTLVRYFCRGFAPSGTRPKRFSREAMGFLVRYSWPGNVRELENFVRSVLLFVDGDRIRLADVRQFDDFFAGGELLAEAPPFFADYVERTVTDSDESVGEARSIPASSEPPTAQSTEAFAQWAIASNLGLHELKRDLEVALIRQALLDSDGNISQSAKLLDMKRPRLSQIVNSTPELLELRERLARKSGEA